MFFSFDRNNKNDCVQVFKFSIEFRKMYVQTKIILWLPLTWRLLLWNYIRPNLQQKNEIPSRRNDECFRQQILDLARRRSKYFEKKVKNATYENTRRRRRRPSTKNRTRRPTGKRTELVSAARTHTIPNLWTPPATRHLSLSEITHVRRYQRLNENLAQRD